VLNFVWWGNLWACWRMLELSQVESEHECSSHEEEKEDSKNYCCDHPSTSFFFFFKISCKKLKHISISDFLSFSEVSSLFDVLWWLLGKLDVSVEIKMLLFDWIHGLDDVPVDSLGTRWGCDWSFVNPTVASVNCLKEFTVMNKGRSWVLFIVLKRIEKPINKSNCFCWNAFIVVFGIEDNTNCSSSKSISFIGGHSILWY